MNPYASSCAFVAKNPKWVFINDEKIDRYATELALQDLKIPSWRTPAYPEDDDQIIDFLGVVNSVNFCFTDFKTHKKFDIEYPEGSGNIWYGAYGMAMCFRRALDEGIPVLDPRFLMNLSEGDARHIFRHKNTPIPMLQERINNLKNVGLTLFRIFGSFEWIFKQNNFRFYSIVNRLFGYFNSYYDSGFVLGREILFMKRAQLFPMVYHGRALSSLGRLQPIRDPENFGPISDYEVPKILRHFDVLRYSVELAAIVDVGMVLVEGSEMEVEIRAQTVNAMSDLLCRINEKRLSAELIPITMAELDYTIWNMGRSDEFKKLRHHYTYTTAY